jgi:hypothetical protein
MARYCVPLITFSNSIRQTYSSSYKTHIVFFRVPERQISNTFRWTSGVKDSTVFWGFPWHRKNFNPGNEASMSFRYVVTPFQSARRHIPEKTIREYQRSFSNFTSSRKCGFEPVYLCRPSSTVLAPRSVDISRWNYDSLYGILKQTSGSCKKCSAYSVRCKIYSGAGDTF